MVLLDSDAPLPCIELEYLEPYEMGTAIGERFSALIKKRVEEDQHLQNELLPFATSARGKKLIHDLTATNKNAFPRYWDELRGIADGSSTSFLELFLLNLRKEITPFLSTVSQAEQREDEENDCSDVLVCKPELIVVAHNEDANVSVEGHAYLVHAKLSNGVSFVAYTYAGELPTCAFGFNSFGVAFTLNAVPLVAQEVAAGGIGRNFISRDLLEATDLMDALKRVQNPGLSSGHSYNLLDINAKRILNVETASKERYSVLEISEEAYFHANMYLHLEVEQVMNDNSIHRQKRAAELPKSSLEEILGVLGDDSDHTFPIYMSGPTLCTLCTAVFDANHRTMRLYMGNSKTTASSFVLSLDI